MIIKIMPENEFEKQKIQEVEHIGVKEFFMFGNKKDKDGDLVDFHDWSGSYRYLEGSLYHFLTTITEEKKSKSNKPTEISLNPQGKAKTPFIKKGSSRDGDIKLIDVDDLSKKAKEDSTLIQFPDIKTATVTENDNEYVERLEVVKDDDLEAEDKE